MTDLGALKVITGSNNRNKELLIKYKESTSIGHLDIQGDLLSPVKAKHINKEIIAEFILFLWKHVYKYLSKKIGLVIDFRSNLTDSSIEPLEFNSKGYPTKFYMSCSLVGNKESDVLETIAHEFIHIDQYFTNGLRVIDDTVYYNGKTYPFEEDIWYYLYMEHEKDAYFNEEKIVDLFRQDFTNHIFESKMIEKVKDSLVQLSATMSEEQIKSFF